MNAAVVPAKLRRPCAPMTCAPAVAVGIVIVVLKLPVAVVLARPSTVKLSQDSATVSPA